MSTNWMADIADMHRKFGVKTAVSEFDKEKLEKFLQFRVDFLQEELDEMKTAEKAEDVVDALIDLCVVAIGTLDAFNVNSYEAWNRVHEKNMQKEVGIKESRPNPLGLPDLIKPEGWESPTHFDNIGLLDTIFTVQAVEAVVEEVVVTPVEEVEEAPAVEEVVATADEVSIEITTDETPVEEVETEEVTEEPASMAEAIQTKKSRKKSQEGV